VLPFVRRWRELSTPLDEARALRAAPRGELPRVLRCYATAVDALTAALTHTPTFARPVRGPAAITAPTPRRSR
jgi:hypothetical protein